MLSGPPRGAWRVDGDGGDDKSHDESEDCLLERPVRGTQRGAAWRTSRCDLRRAYGSVAPAGDLALPRCRMMPQELQVPGKACRPRLLGCVRASWRTAPTTPWWMLSTGGLVAYDAALAIVSWPQKVTWLRV